MINRNINPTLFNNIVNLLTPYMAEGDRDTLITPAFSGYPKIYGKIDQSGSAGTFTVRLIRLLAHYGEIETGVSALSHLLEAVRPHVGLDVQRDIDGLLQELKDQKSNSQLGKGRPLRVFLCHGSSDKAEVRNLYKRLKQDGMDPWLDEEKLMPGQQWQREIPRAVRQSDVVLVALSHNAVNAEGYIQNEIGFALEVANELPDETIYIIPVKLEACDAPEQLVPWHWVDLFDARGYERLIKALQIRAQGLNAQPPVWNSGEYKYVTKYKQKNPFQLPWLMSSIIAIILTIWVASDYLLGWPTAISSRPPSTAPPTLSVTSVLVPTSTGTPIPELAIHTPTVALTSTPVEPTVTPTEVLTNTPSPTATNTPIPEPVTHTPTVVSTSTPIELTATPTEVLTNTPLPTATDTPAPDIVTPTSILEPTITPTLGIGSTYFDSIGDATYLYVPVGEFIMGSDDGSDDEKPQRTVYLDSYWIMETEVTNAQYRKFIKAGGYTTKLYWSTEGWSWRGTTTEPRCWNNSKYNGDEQPVVCVSWYEAQAYAKWLAIETGLDIALPTEAQWEKAARGTDGRVYPWGNEWDDNKANSHGSDDGYEFTAPVGSYPTGASFYGALDMTGNVWEWTSDWYDSEYYRDSPIRNPSGPESGEFRVLRGGSWDDTPYYMRAANRFRGNPDYWFNNVGVRLWLASSPD